MKKNNYILILSVISALFVVCLHMNFSWTYFTTEKWWLTSNIFRGVCYPAVPIFFMITGVTLMDYKKKYDTKTFFKKRSKKILIPFLVWSVIAIIYNLATHQISIEDLSVHSILYGIINTKYQDVYWFFPAYISICLCMPLFASINDDSKKKVFAYLVVVYLIFNCIYPFVNTLFKLNIPMPISVYSLSGYIFYPVLGYLLHNCELKKKHRCVIYLFGLIGLLSITLGTYFYSMHDGKINDVFMGYQNLPCVLYAAAIFVFVKYTAKYILKYNIVLKTFNLIGSYTFAIYLIHNFVRNFIVITFHPNTVSVWWRTVCVIPIAAICIAIAYILRKIKYVRAIVPE
nr:acyltransferase family protein [Bacilli bacterium]